MTVVSMPAFVLWEAGLCLSTLFLTVFQLIVTLQGTEETG